MAIGSVTVVQLNNAQGNFKEVERVFLYIGKADAEVTTHEVIPIGAESDLDEMLGAGTSELKTQIAAAVVNSRSENFACYALPIGTGDDWKAAALAALDKPLDLGVECIVVCSPVTSKAEAEACQTTALEIRTKYAKFVSVFAAVAGINPETETWAQYLTKISAINTGVAAERVVLVPLLHGNDLGVVCGRLCDPGVSLADSPMRVKTGALVGLGTDPVDSADSPLNSATVKTIAEARFSVAQWYPGYAGMYWADHITLDAEAGDFQEWENLRVLDYIARRVRILAIAKIADRALNSTDKSIAFHKTYFARPLREASKSITVGNVELPAMIRPPFDSDITIVWESRTSVQIGIVAQPYNCPKKIKVYLALDLSGTN